MNGDYYGAPRPAGEYVEPSSSSSAESVYISEPASSPSYFESYKADTLYPDFLSNYGDSLLTAAPTTPNADALAQKESRRKRVLSDLDTSTLRTLLELVRGQSSPSIAPPSSLSLEEAILEELNERDNAREGGTQPFVIDWNGQFQALVEAPDSIDKFAKLRDLANDFCFTAELYARVIISELYLPVSQKTIKPAASLGGVAGGQKFVVQGILFKFSVDVELIRTVQSAPTPPTDKNKSSAAEEPKYESIWMYGGAAPATEYAMKAAKHELRSTISYFATGACRVPLVALVDFRGYRVLCSSILPIDTTTICYGSSDGGKSVHNDEEAAALFEAAAKKLNLKKHRFKNVDLHAPVDVEGHHGHDGRMYCIDLARLFPPEAPNLALQNHRRAMFFRLLRPELVRIFPAPLSSDAYTNFGSDNSLEHNAEVEQATRHLQEKIILTFSRSLSAVGSAVNSFDSLITQAHQNGINLRYLGLVRSNIIVPQHAHPTRRIYIPHSAHNNFQSLSRSLESSEPGISLNTSSGSIESTNTGAHTASRAEEMMATLDETASLTSSASPLRTSKASPAVINPYGAEEAVRQLLLQEMIARVLKCMLRAQWRKRMQQVRICTETPFASVFLDLINLVGHKSHLSSQFWTRQLKEELKAKYSVGLSDLELDEHYDLSSSIELRSLLERFVALVGVKISLSPEILMTKKRPFLYTDIQAISSTIHHMNIVDFAEGCLLALTARKREKGLKIQLLSMAESKLAAAQGTSVNLSVVFELANVHYEKSMLLPLQECTSNVIEAIRCYRATLQLNSAQTSPRTIGQCHIRLLRLFFDRIGANILLQEASLQAQGILEMSIAKHLDKAAEMRPRAFRKLLAAVAALPDAEPHDTLLSNYLPDCSQITAFSTLLTCLVHSREETRSLAREVFADVIHLNFQFCSQLLDPRNSGWMIGTRDGIWTWPGLQAVDLTYCATATSAALNSLLSSCPALSRLVLNHCLSVDDNLAAILVKAPCVASRSLKEIEIATCRVSDDFFMALDKSELLLPHLVVLNIRKCVLLTDATLKIITNSSANSLEALFIDQCPKIVEIKCIKRLKKLKELGLSESKASEPKLKEIIVKFLERGGARRLALTETAIEDKTFDFMTPETLYNDMRHLDLRKTKITKNVLQAVDASMPRLESLFISLCELGHGFGKFINQKHLKRFESSLNKWTSGCDIALVHLKDIFAPLEHLNARSCWNTITDPVLLMSIRSFASLTSLNISVCTSLSNAAMESVSNLSRLKFLSLSGNRQLVDSALIRIAKALGESLVGLEIAHCKQISTFGLESVAKYCTNLRYVDISFLESFRRIHSLGNYCLKLENLRAVGLSGCSAESFQRIFNRGISLRKLNLKSCPVTNEAVVAMAFSCRYLVELCLSDCSAVDDVGITRLLQLCLHIQKLELTSVSLTDSSFLQSPKSIGFLRHLNLSGCHRLTDKTLQVLQKQSTLLEFINCSGCPMFGEAAMVGLLQAAPFLNVVSVAFCPRISEDTITSVLSPRGGVLVK